MTWLQTTSKKPLPKPIKIQITNLCIHPQVEKIDCQMWEDFMEDPANMRIFWLGKNI